MSEKRKPLMKIVASVSGKRKVIELYEASLWPGKFGVIKERGEWYRVRIDGKWVHGDHVFQISDVMAQLRSWIAGRTKEFKRKKGTR